MNTAVSNQEKSKSEIDPKVYDCKGAAKYMSVSYYTVRNWAHAGLIPCVILPAPFGNGRSMRKLLFLKSDLDRFLALHRVEARG